MVKDGPCYHCGVTSTPLWRNGPPDKPVLCNACGSRWRTKGTLANYTPLHARAGLDEFEAYRVARVKSISIKNRESKVLKRKRNHGNAFDEGIASDHNQGFRKTFDEDTSNRSSSGSAISNSESCAQFGSADASDLTGPAQSVVWDTTVPSRKRTCVGRPKTSPFEKLTKDLYTILHEEKSSYFSESSENDLLFESDTPMVSVEIGHGSVLIRHPSSIAREDESEVSSLSVNNKPLPANEAYSRLTILPVNVDNKGANFQHTGIEEIKKPTKQGMQQEKMERGKALTEKLQILGNINSPLCYIDLKDVLNFNKFSSFLTYEEQQQLLKYLPSVDTARFPDSLKSMFNCPQLEENLFSFQKLLAEGVFDLSFSGGNTEEYRVLKRLALCNFSKSKWVEQYNLVKDVKYKTSVGSSDPGGLNSISLGDSVILKRFRDSQHQNNPGTKMTLKSSKRAIMKGIYEHNELVDDDSSCFSTKSLFALPPDSSSLMLDTFRCMDESSDQGLLLDVPSSSSFPQAELLFPTSSFCSRASDRE
ncbi:GATA transcription factor 26-like isoform X2 [Cornus florida]|uniref:GATA transcription factor 26-like isoform X2 n=1 Tax=Cornus florida TaxID=4283 RepID=UPI0028973CD1|nr:GATA transcription factor 26-like isoform X2 [Cornus florida]